MGCTQELCETFLNKSWKQHPLKTAAVCHLRSISQTNQVRRTSDVYKRRTPVDSFTWIHQQRLVFISSVGTLDAIYMTYQKRLLIKTNGERESRESVLSARLDDEDNDVFYIYIYLLVAE